MKQNRKLKQILLPLLLCAVLLTVVIGGLYMADYYHHGKDAERVLQCDTVVQERFWLSLEAESAEVGLIFYPGAKVDYRAYLPLLNQLQAAGVNCYLVKMPLNMAVLGMNRAEQVLAEKPNIRHWVMAGHSHGGAIASAFASKHSDTIEALILLGAYSHGDYPVAQTLTVYGSEDRVLDVFKIARTENVRILPGGNHAQFGDYGIQKNDGVAFITPEQQREETVSLMLPFIDAIRNTAQ